MTQTQRCLRLASLLLWLAGCSSDADKPEPNADAGPNDSGVADAGKTNAQPSQPATLGPAKIAPWGFDLTGMNESIRPGNSFYRYANGHWLDEHQIPDDRVAWQSTSPTATSRRCATS